MKGKANHPMEDYHVAKFLQKRGHELGLFAIFDGHLGDSVPVYLQNHLFSNILNEVGFNVIVLSTTEDFLQSYTFFALMMQAEFWVNPVGSISKTYTMTDQTILSSNSGLGHGGSTAVTAILIDGRSLYVANVGDSRAVLSRGGTAIQMSIDHEPSTERHSIESKGGFVSNMPGSLCAPTCEIVFYLVNEYKITYVNHHGFFMDILFIWSKFV